MSGEYYQMSIGFWITAEKKNALWQTKSWFMYGFHAPCFIKITFMNEHNLNEFWRLRLIALSRYINKLST